MVFGSHIPRENLESINLVIAETDLLTVLLGLRNNLNRRAPNAFQSNKCAPFLATSPVVGFFAVIQHLSIVTW